MGVPGLWDILRPTGEVHSLTHLAVQSGFEKSDHRAYRIGIDASIWFFHAQGGREGENPELRTLFFRCSRLLAMPFLPIFVFDGPKRPKIKRGKAVGGKEHWMVNNLRSVLNAFGFECRTAPGEAEAELAYLNRIGVIDAVLSDDVDCFLFGARTVIRNSSATLSGNRNHSARNTDGKDDGQHVYMYHLKDIESNPKVNLSPGGLILIGLLRGGDYDQQGIDGCGVSTAHALARAGFGDSLLTAARSPTPGALAAFLPAWRNALRHELRTNSSGLAPRKSPTLAQRIHEDFPRLDVLRCYTHPVTSESEGTGTRGLNSLWRTQADVAKIAHVCEMYFEWGVEASVIKRFRSFLWPGAVLRHLLKIALDKDNRGRSHVCTPTQRNEGDVETPSKALARTLRDMALDTELSDDDDEFTLITAIHGERRHASTDHTLEYRLEIDPRELVARARSGIQGLRTELEDSAAAGTFDDDDDGDEDGDGKKKRGLKMPPPDPDSVLRVWMPAVMVQYACPRLMQDYMEQKTAKEEKKKGKGKSVKKVRQEEDEEGESTPAKRVKPRTTKNNSEKTAKAKVSYGTDGLRDEEESTPAKPVKPKTTKDNPKKTAKAKVSCVSDGLRDEEESTLAKPVKPKMTKDNPKKTAKVKVSCVSDGHSEDNSPIRKVKAKGGTSRKPTTTLVKPTLSATTSNSQYSQSRSPTTQLVDEDPFLASSTISKPDAKTKPAARPQSEIEQSSSKHSLIPRPFPMDFEDVFAGPSLPQSSTSTPGRARKYSCSPTSSAAEHVVIRTPSNKSPRKSTEQTSPRTSSGRVSPSPLRPSRAPKMKPLHRAMARPVASKTDDDIIIISSDSDDGQANTRMNVKTLHTNSRKALNLTNLNFQSEVIDLT